MKKKSSQESAASFRIEVSRMELGIRDNGEQAQTKRSLRTKAVEQVAEQWGLDMATAWRYMRDPNPNPWALTSIYWKLALGAPSTGLASDARGLRRQHAEQLRLRSEALASFDEQMREGNSHSAAIMFGRYLELNHPEVAAALLAHLGSK